TALGVEVARIGDVMELGARTAVVALGPATIVAHGAKLALVRGRGEAERDRIRALAAETIDAQLNLPGRTLADSGAAPPDTPATPVSASPAVTAARVERTRRKAGTIGPDAAPGAEVSSEQTTNALAARATLVAAATALDRALDESAKLELPSVHAEIRR